MYFLIHLIPLSLFYALISHIFILILQLSTVHNKHRNQSHYSIQAKQMSVLSVVMLCHLLHMMTGLNTWGLVKVKVSAPLYRHRGSVQAVWPIGGSRGIALLFLDHSIRKSESSVSCPGRSLPPGKTRYPLYRRLGEPQGWSGQVRKISPPPGFNPRTIQPVASCYTDWATRPQMWGPVFHKNVRAIKFSTKYNFSPYTLFMFTQIWHLKPSTARMTYDTMKCMRLLDWEQSEMRIVFIVVAHPPHLWWQNGNELLLLFVCLFVCFFFFF